MEREERAKRVEGGLTEVEEERSGRPSRRDFLKGVGAAGAGLMAGSLGVDQAVARPGYRRHRRHRMPGHSHGASIPGTPVSSADFGRMFPSLRPFVEANDKVRAALTEIGKPGGILDAKDNLAAGPKALILDPTVNGNPTATDPYGSNPDNPTMTAGSTFIGQFTDHDITFDQTSQLGVPQNPLTSKNTRTPALDLDSVFGGGPGIRPDLYEPNPDGTVGPKMRIGSGGVHEDVPRVGDGDNSAVIGDPRNDENLMLAGLHCAHILFYNRVLDELAQHDLGTFPAARGNDLAHRNVAFLTAREVTLWHYQWLLVNEHLPQIAGQAMVDDVIKHGNRFYKPPRGDGFMPIEFGGAAYRFGHSMVRPSYRANFTSGTGDSANPAANPFFGLVFDPNEPIFDDPKGHDRNDLAGGFPAPRRYIGWQTFFDLGDGQVKKNKKVDTDVSSVLFKLPLPAIAPHTETAPVVLAQRNLLRALTWGLPSGQDVARAIGAQCLSSAELSEISGVYRPFGTSTPLWYYVLAEAKAAAGGLNLGPVGGRIVTETLIGLLRADPTSYLSVKPDFQPFLGTDLKLGPNVDPSTTGNRSYTRAHFLYYAGVVQPGTYR
jgi:Animal haem peroxidase/TAT (twin-arginine translocation) pathway signal sequence